MLVNPEMYEGSACYDPTTHLIDQQDDDNNNNINNNNPLSHPNFTEASTTDYHHLINMENQMIHDLNWGGITGIQMDNDNTILQPPPDLLLNLFQLPRSSISFSNPPANYDPLLPLNLPPQPPLFRELLHNGYNLQGGGGLILGEMDHDGDGILKFSSSCNGKGREIGKDTKHFATEKHRRQQLNDKFDALKNLVPNPTKADRASVVGDAIEYINELKRTVEELTILVERKRGGRMKKHKIEDESALDVESINTKPNDQGYNANSTSTLRSSWLQRKSKNTEVDVRIINDEVNIKLVQQKRINCLLLVSKVLDELHLDLNHVAGGLIGDFYSYLFNTKIYEGSSVYASAIANKLLEVLDRHYASIPATTGY